jgi:hypothetical protein
MAVRNDFAAGEVLAAADLNDTFGSKLDTSAYTAPGLILIATDTFSAVSSVSVNGCFSATYTYYKLVLELTSMAANVALRWRVGGTDNTASNYETSGGGNNINSFVGFTSTVETSHNLIGNVSGSTVGRAELDIFNPFGVAPTNALGLCVHHNANANLSMRSFRHTTSTSFNGFTLFPASSTISGNLRVYGYKD